MKNTTEQIAEISARLQSHSGKLSMVGITIKDKNKKYLFTTRQFGNLQIHADDENPDIYWYIIKDTSFRADMVKNVEIFGAMMDVRIEIELNS